MPFQQNSRLASRRTGLKVSGTVIVMLGILAGGVSHAAEWGRARILSGVGQPLSVEIPVRDLPAGLAPAGITASVEAGHATNAGLADRQAMPVSATLLPRADGRAGAILVLTSAQPVPRGVVDLALQLDLPSGPESRRIVLLLAPAKAASLTPVRLAVTGPAGSVLVARGDTLGAIAARLRRQAGAESGSLEQWLVALFQANPAAFIQGNLHLVRAGATLAVPSADAVRAIDPGTARRLVAAHLRDFVALRGKVARQAPMAAASTPAADLAASQGAVAAPAPVPAPAQNRDTLRLSSLLPGNGTAHAATRDSQAVIDQLRDERAATQKALDEARSRVGELESTVREMEQLLSLQNEALARLQQQRTSSTESGAATATSDTGGANGNTPSAAAGAAGRMANGAVAVQETPRDAGATPATPGASPASSAGRAGGAAANDAADSRNDVAVSPAGGSGQGGAAATAAAVAVAGGRTSGATDAATATGTPPVAAASSASANTNATAGSASVADRSVTPAGGGVASPEAGTSVLPGGGASVPMRSAPAQGRIGEASPTGAGAAAAGDPGAAAIANQAEAGASSAAMAEVARAMAASTPGAASDAAADAASVPRASDATGAVSPTGAGNGQAGSLGAGAPAASLADASDASDANDARGSLPALAGAPAARPQDTASGQSPTAAPGGAEGVGGSSAPAVEPSAGAQGSVTGPASVRDSAVSTGSAAAQDSAAPADSAAAQSSGTGTGPATAAGAATSANGARNGSAASATPPAVSPPAAPSPRSPEAESDSFTAWGLGALIVFALAVVAYLLRRKPESVVLDDSADADVAPLSPPPPLKVDFDLDLDSPPSDGQKPTGDASSGPAQGAARGDDASPPRQS